MIFSSANQSYQRHIFSFSIGPIESIEMHIFSFNQLYIYISILFNIYSLKMKINPKVKRYAFKLKMLSKYSFLGQRLKLYGELNPYVFTSSLHLSSIGNPTDQINHFGCSYIRKGKNKYLLSCCFLGTRPNGLGSLFTPIIRLFFYVKSHLINRETGLSTLLAKVRRNKIFPKHRQFTPQSRPNLIRIQQTLQTSPETPHLNNNAPRIFPSASGWRAIPSTAQPAAVP
eukprot:TRINITY_DN991_c2_g2_i1.p1 TRINITY_DN991_c2_g2~~TRINITY_DN991_c2_g2_i1.p1  ORF type:complete len:228 (-),score=-12.91 TRINITY_DN991_c2_g2_i1:18-701(-)